MQGDWTVVIDPKKMQPQNEHGEREGLDSNQLTQSKAFVHVLSFLKGD